MFLQKSFFGYPSGVASRGIVAFALGAFALAAGPAQAADTATAEAEAVVLDNTRLQNVAALQFGRIVPSGTGGAVMINVNNGAVSTIGEVVTVGSNQTRARFTVKAPIGIIIIIAGDPTVELVRVGDTRPTPDAMIASLTHRGTTGFITANVFGLPIGLIATSPDQEIFTGGTLVVAGNQVEGAYEGNFNLMVSFL